MGNNTSKGQFYISMNVYQLKHIGRNTFIEISTNTSKWELTPPNYDDKKGLAFFFDECVSTNVLQLVHIGRKLCFRGIIFSRNKPSTDISRTGLSFRPDFSSFAS